MWTKYRVTWDFLTSICGSVPSDPEVVKKWLEVRMPNKRPPDSRSMDEINTEVLASIERGDVFDEKQCQILVFQRDKGVCAQRAATVRAHIKDCARVLSGYQAKDDNTRSFATRIINTVYHDPREYWLPILRQDGTPIEKADDRRDLFVHPKPGISALKSVEYIMNARLVFTLLVLQTAGGKNAVAEEDLHKLFQYGGVHGYGGERGNGEGRYDYRLEKLEAPGGRTAATNDGGTVPKAGAAARRR